MAEREDDPYPNDHGPVRSTEEARSGRTRGIVRYVLGASLALVIVAFLLSWVVAV